MKDPARNENFISGTESFSTKHLNKKLKITNGTRIKYYSICVINENQLNYINAQIKSQSIGTIIYLVEPPFAINIELLDIDSKYYNLWRKKLIDVNKIIVPI